MTFRVSDEMVTEIEDMANERDISKSEVARELLDLGSEYADLQTENERLQRRVSALIQQREEHGELVAYVEDERELRRRREQRQEQRRQSNAFQRFAWWVFGEPADEIEERDD